MRTRAWKVGRSGAGILAVLVILVPACTLAIHATDGPMPLVEEGGAAAFAVRGSVGMLSGEAREYVYIPDIGHRMSELIWDLSNITMAGVVASANLYNSCHVNIGFWTAMTEGNGGMKDYDWYLYDQPDTWTHQSIHSVRVVRSFIFDLNVSTELYAFNSLSLRGMIGIRRDYWQWEDAIIEYTYSSLGDPLGEPIAGYSNRQFDPTALRDVKVQGDGSRTIDYEQTFTIPYVGTSLERTMGSLHLNGYLTLSLGVVAEDVDFHRLREIHFTETFTGGTFVGLGASAVYGFTDSMYAMVAYDAQSVSEIRGDMEIRGIPGKSEDAAGISNEHGMLSGSLGMAF